MTLSFFFYFINKIIHRLVGRCIPIDLQWRDTPFACMRIHQRNIQLKKMLHKPHLNRYQKKQGTITSV
jgi:hypothetical protein